MERWRNMGVAQNKGWSEGYRAGYKRGKRARSLNQAPPWKLLIEESEHASGFRAGYFAVVRGAAYAFGFSGYNGSPKGKLQSPDRASLGKRIAEYEAAIARTELARVKVFCPTTPTQKKGRREASGQS